MHILITAGPTREPIDAVRFISNRSSGKMGLALAQAAVQAGHEVTLLLGPVALEAPPHGVRVYRFESSAELKQLLEAHFRGCDLLIMAAAVADYRPQCVVEGKLPREPGKPMVLVLEPTPDLVALTAQTRRSGQRIVAFALEEPARLEERARAKMQRKGVDAIVANPLGTMESEGIAARLLWADGRVEQPPGPSLLKTAFAHWLIERCVRG